MRYFSAFASLFLFLFLFSCANKQEVAQSTPEEAARGLFDALKVDDFERARLFGTNTTQESLLNFETNLKMVSEEEKKDLTAPFKLDISKVTCIDNQGSMNCTLCCSTDGDIIIEMVEQDNKWFAKIDFAY